MTLPAAAPALHAAKSERNASGGFLPTRVIEVELTEPLPKLDHDGHYGRAWILARLHTEPIGVCVVTLPREGIAPDALAALMWTELSGPVAQRFEAAGLTAPAALTGSGLAADPEAWPFLRERAALLASAPFISVVVCTRDRPEQIKKCLSRLARQQYPRYEVVVVDNAPTSDALRKVVEGQAGEGAEFRYCVEPRPGLSWARNAGIAAAASDIIAFLDDDDEPDEHWLAGVADGFARGERVGCVSGVVLPARLDNAVENLFEEIGGHSKGRGFVKETFSKSGPQSPLWPLPPFGVGANMAFRREALDRIGGFDVALGAGHPDRGRRGHARDNARHALRLRGRLRARRPHVASPPPGHGQPQQAAARVQRRADRLLRRPAAAAAGRVPRPGQVAPHGGRLPEGREGARRKRRPRSPRTSRRNWTAGSFRECSRGRWSTPKSRRMQRRVAAAARS